MYYRVGVEAKYSDEYIVRAKDAADAKQKAIKKFMKSKNFEASISGKSKNRDDSQLNFGLGY